jgi:hypothetical protein
MQCEPDLGKRLEPGGGHCPRRLPYHQISAARIEADQFLASSGADFALAIEI